MKINFRRFFNFFISFVVLVTALFPNWQPSFSAQAQAQDDIHREYNAETGRVNLITGVNHAPISVSGAGAAGISSETQSLAIMQRFAPEFGLTDPLNELRLSDTNRTTGGRVITKYQQIYQGVPVIAGELIVNANKAGALVSMNGEVSPDISLDTNPKLTGGTAIEIARQGMSKWYGGDTNDYTSTQSSLWIFDEKLLRSSVRPANLVWRIEMIPAQEGAPIRELVLVDAKSGNVSLHFNQVDTAWGENEASKINAVRDEHKEIASSNAPLNTEIPAAAGTTWYVSTTGNDANDCLSPSTPCATINGTIGKSANGDTIKVATGTYTGTGTEVVLINKSVTISGGWNAAFTTQSGMSIIDGQSLRRGVNIPYIYPVLITATTMERFTIQNGFSSSMGGGIYNSYGSLTLNDSIVNSNVSNWMGGGIYNLGTLTINTTTISGNSAGVVGNSGGGGGGGIENDGGSVTLNNSLVAGNFILGSYSGSGINTFGTVILNNSTVSGNTGGDGVGISTFVGAIALNNSTISNNQSYGIKILGGSVTLQNTIVARNGRYGDCYNDISYSGTVISQGYNLIGDSTFCAFATVAGDIKGTSANPINPRLNYLQDNGGATFTHALGIGSLAINAGNPATPGSGGTACLATDQRGLTRPVDSHCDIGAYEGSAPFAPSPLVDTYTSGGSWSLPGFFLCNQFQLNCTNNANPHADAAHKYAIGTYNFYAAKHLRDSIDNNGMPIISTVHYGSGYANAFWNGLQMVYGDGYGFALADDVVAHELTHGVTDYESNLFYYYQSGAINESFSDVWGEYYDQTNGLGSDTLADKWLMGEDVSGLGALRSMSNPPLFGDPDKITSLNYDFDVDMLDNGGVHSNSGINNKAVFLMVDGGTFNSITVSALGWDKIAAIYYEVQSNLLSSGADYSDLYFAVQQACVNLTGQFGITVSNCQQVKNALDAVEMNAQPYLNYNPDAPACAANMFMAPIFQDNMENGASFWQTTGTPQNAWYLTNGYASSATNMLYGDDSYSSNDSSIRMTTGLALPVSSNMYLHFKHAFGFESYAGITYDGGVLEYTINNGANWVDASSLFADGQNYKGVISNYSGTTNALKGRYAFVGDSHGYVSSRYNLTSLGGQTVKFRWRFATDEIVSYLGWTVDDVQVYKCMPNIFYPTVASSLRAISNPTNAASVKFNVTFSESVTGVDAGDFTLTTTDSVSGAAVIGVSGLDSVYTVTVNTGNGPGTIRLDVVDNNSIVDAASNPLGGAAVGDGNFTGGELYDIGQIITIIKAGTGSGTVTSSPVGVNCGVDCSGHYSLNTIVTLTAVPDAGTLFTGWSGGGCTGAGSCTVTMDSTKSVTAIFRTDGPSVSGDYDGDGRSDLAVFRPSSGMWIVKDWTTNTEIFRMPWGGGADKLVPADYNGDGKTDIAVFRASSLQWIVKDWQTNTEILRMSWGGMTDIPVPGDYNGDGKADLAVYRPSTGMWIVKDWTTNTEIFRMAWGGRADKPVPADYNGDGKTDIAVFRANSLQWIVKDWATNTEILRMSWGGMTDIPVPGDYNGDGKADLAVYRPSSGMWIVKDWTTNTEIFRTAWGGGADKLVPGDYNGDLKTDIGVFRASSLQWIVKDWGSNTEILRMPWGGMTDIPLYNLVGLR